MSRSEQGFTLIEILVALLIFSIVAVGTITVIGAATAGGFVDAFPTAFAATRAARDYTAASTYLQALQEFAANQGFSAAAVDPTTKVATYCVEGPALGSGCSSPNPLPWGPLTPAGPTPAPPAAPYQLAWDKLEVVIEQWYWDGTVAPDLGKYCLPAGCGATATGESVKLVRATLTWIFKNETTTQCWGDTAPTAQRAGRCLTVKRFLRSSP